MDIVMRFVLLIYQIGSRAASLSDLYSLLDVSTLCVSLCVCVCVYLSVWLSVCRNFVAQ